MWNKEAVVKIVQEAYTTDDTSRVDDFFTSPAKTEKWNELRQWKLRSVSPKLKMNTASKISIWSYSKSAWKRDTNSKSPKISMKSVTDISTINPGEYLSHNEGHCSSSRYCDVCKWKSYWKE